MVSVVFFCVRVTKKLAHTPKATHRTAHTATCGKVNSAVKGFVPYLWEGQRETKLPMGEHGYAREGQFCSQKDLFSTFVKVKETQIVNAAKEVRSVLLGRSKGTQFVIGSTATERLIFAPKMFFMHFLGRSKGTINCCSQLSLRFFFFSGGPCFFG